MKTLIICSALLPLLISPLRSDRNTVSNSGSSTWELEKEKNDIKVYTRKIEGFDVVEFKAIGYIDAPYHQVFNVINDTENYHEWYPDCDKGEVIDQAGDFSKYQRLVYKLPWPFKPRDVIQKADLYQIKNGVRLDLSNASGYIEDQKGTIRISDSRGFWELVQEQGGTRVTYQAVGDSGGIPSWIVNLFVVGGPIKAIVNIRERVRLSEYKRISDFLVKE